MEAPMSSSEASPDFVRTCLTPESEPVWMVIDQAFGSKWPAAFAFLHPEWSSSKTSQDSCVPFQAARESLLSESYSLTWPNSGMTLDGVAYELPTWELHIFEAESLSSPGTDLLPTPSANDRTVAESLEGRESRGAGGSSLRDLPKLLPTPAADEAGGTVERHLERKNLLDGRNRVTPTGLGLAVKTLPTPTAGDANSSGSRNLEGSKAKPGVSLTDAVRFGDSKTPRLLLPTPMANEENPGSGGELRAALTHGPGRRNETGVDTWGRPNLGRPSKLMPTPMRRDGESSSEQGLRGEKNQTLLGAAREVTGMSRLLPTPTTQDAANNAGPSQHRRNSDPLNVVAAKTLLPSPSAHPAGRGKGSAERYKGPKSQGGRRSNLEDAIEAVEEGSPWIGESSSQPFDAGNPSLDLHPDQLTISGDSMPDSASGCSDTQRDGLT